MGDTLHGEHRERLHLVVIAGVIAKGPLWGQLTGLDIAFENDLGGGRHLQLGALALHHLGLRAAQQPREGILRQAVGDRGHGGQGGGGIGTQHHRHREALPGMGLAPLLEIQRTAAVGEPAHDQPVAPDHLLAVDAHVLALPVRGAGHDQAPGDQRAGVLRPAGLHRQPGQVHLAALGHHLLAGRALALLGPHVEGLAQHRDLLP